MEGQCAVIREHRYLLCRVGGLIVVGGVYSNGLGGGNLWTLCGQPQFTCGTYIPLFCAVHVEPLQTSIDYILSALKTLVLKKLNLSFKELTLNCKNFIGIV